MPRNSVITSVVWTQIFASARVSYPIPLPLIFLLCVSSRPLRVRFTPSCSPVLSNSPSRALCARLLPCLSPTLGEGLNPVNPLRHQRAGTYNYPLPARPGRVPLQSGRENSRPYPGSIPTIKHQRCRDAGLPRPPALARHLRAPFVPFARGKTLKTPGIKKQISLTRTRNSVCQRNLC